MENAERRETPDALRAIERNLAEVRDLIRAACLRAGRPRDSVALLPVVKAVDAATAALLHRLGVRDLAEGTLQGATAKAEALAGLEGLRWHLVGHLQTNKARKAAGLFASIHSLAHGQAADDMNAIACPRP